MHVRTVGSISACILVVEVAEQLIALILGCFDFLSAGHPRCGLPQGSGVASVTGTAFPFTLSSTFAVPFTPFTSELCFSLLLDVLDLLLLILMLALLLLHRRWSKVEVEVDRPLLFCVELCLFHTRRESATFRLVLTEEVPPFLSDIHFYASQLL